MKLISAIKIIICLVIAFNFIPSAEGNVIHYIPWQVNDPDQLMKWLSDNFVYSMEAADKWQTPEETIDWKSGDCEDFAILVSAVLTELGIKNKIAVIKYKGMRTKHAICVWRNKSGNYSYTSNLKIFHTKCKSMKTLMDNAYPDWEYVYFTNQKGAHGESIANA